MKITSSAFQNNSRIPPKYTCDGRNINPPLTFSNYTKKMVEEKMQGHRAGTWNGELARHLRICAAGTGLY